MIKKISFYLLLLSLFSCTPTKRLIPQTRISTFTPFALDETAMPGTLVRIKNGRVTRLYPPSKLKKYINDTLSVSFATEQSSLLTEYDYDQTKNRYLSVSDSLIANAQIGTSSIKKIDVEINQGFIERVAGGELVFTEFKFQLTKDQKIELEQLLTHENDLGDIYFISEAKVYNDATFIIETNNNIGGSVESSLFQIFGDNISLNFRNSNTIEVIYKGGKYTEYKATPYLKKKSKTLAITAASLGLSSIAFGGLQYDKADDLHSDYRKNPSESGFLSIRGGQFDSREAAYNEAEKIRRGSAWLIGLGVPVFVVGLYFTIK